MRPSIGSRFLVMAVTVRAAVYRLNPFISRIHPISPRRLLSGAALLFGACLPLSM
jgi:hypothetical protein